MKKGLFELTKQFDIILGPILKHDLEFEEVMKPNFFFGYVELEKIAEWQTRYGYYFNIHTGDHLIEDKRHFHFENKESNVHLKVDFEGNILENKGKKELPPKVHKILKKFVRLPEVKAKMNSVWEKNNPNL